MAMWGNRIQRVKIVINDSIIEQITDFKYLGYSISEYKSDLEDKLQTYKGKNGSTEHSKGNKTVPGNVATTRIEDGHK